VLTFNPEGHIYFWNGKEVPSVSQILKSIGITRDFDRVDPFYRERGTYVHKAVEFHIKNTLDEESIDHENVWPYLKAFQTFESTEGYCVKHTEIPLYSRKYGFAGTLDHLAEFEDRRFLGEGIADLKVTERSDKAADIQLCLYAELYYENYGKWPAFRMILELHGDKTAKPIFYTANPRKICNAIMRLYEWKITKPEKRLLHAAV
jgi:hypothetical protein